VNVVLLALAVLGFAGVVVGTVAHVVVLLGGGAPGWMEPIGARLTALGFVCFVLVVATGWVTRGWAGIRPPAGLWTWPPGWPAWSKWLVPGYLGYAFIQWARTGGRSPLGITAVWMFVYGTVVVLSIYLRPARDETRLDTPGGSFRRP
jgi:hypothetical protein